MDEAYPFHARSLLIAAGATAICCLCTLFALRSNVGGLFGRRRERKRCGCSSSFSCCCGNGGGAVRGEGCDAGIENGYMAVGEKKAATAERQVGGSMMEQLVPEITTHALSYLDYTSLCRLSMTNSAMRRAANDDGPWKALYHKDFTVEQETITPRNGWKLYYAATKAIINVNAEFYSIIRERSLPRMSRFWLNADYVKCIHATGELFTGYNLVVNSWAVAFNWGQGGGHGVEIQIRDVRARILSDMSWVTMTADVDDRLGPFHVTNVYEFHDGCWYMVHHHSSVMDNDEDPVPHNILG